MILPFSRPDGRLKSYNILKWAAGAGPFILRGVVEQFSELLSKNKDAGGQSLADKDASERLRKLLKSGMIMVVTATSIEAFSRPYKMEVRKKDPTSGRWIKTEVQVEALLSAVMAAQWAEKIAELGKAAGRGRKPRVYVVTRKGLEYVEFRDPPSNENSEEIDG